MSLSYYKKRLVAVDVMVRTHEINYAEGYGRLHAILEMIFATAEVNTNESVS